MGRWGGIAILAAVTALGPSPSAVVAQNERRGPFPVKVIASRYPLLAHLAGVQGDVQLAVTASADGSVRNARVVSGVGLLNESARAMVSKWAFSACEGAPQDCESTVTFRYVLDPGLCANSDCPTEFEFDLPATVTIRSKHRPAIVN